MLSPLLLYSGDFSLPKYSLYTTHNIYLDKGAQKNIIPLKQNTNIKESYKLSNNPPTKPVIIFVGGFLDSFHQVVFREFATFSQDSYPQLSNIPFVAKVYSTFSCEKLFTLLLPEILALSYTPYIIAHSWGARNICKALKNIQDTLPNSSIPLLLTLDPVGYWQPTQPIQCIEQWVNIYIADKWRHFFKTSNICTFIGHAWNECKYANKNIAIKNKHLSSMSDKKALNTRKTPINHASIRTMLSVFDNA